MELILAAVAGVVAFNLLIVIARSRPALRRAEVPIARRPRR